MLKGRKLRGFQAGLETVQGTTVVANRYFPNGTFRNRRRLSIRRGEAEGHRASIGTQRGKRWSEWSITGQLGYNIMAYAGHGLYDKVVATTPTGGVHVRTYQDIQSTYHDPQTFSFEYGNTTGSNSKFAFGTMSDMTIRVGQNAVDYELGGFGAYPTKNITMTASPTTVPASLVSILDCRVSYATTFAGLSAGKLLQSKSIEFNIKGKYKAVFFIDDATTSLGGILENVADCSGSITVAQGTESDAFLAALEGSTQGYLQLRATGNILAAGTPNYYHSILDTWSVFFEDEEETEDDDLFVGRYNFYMAEDVINGDNNFVVQTGLASL